MAHNMFWALLLTAVVVSAPSVWADYEAGQRAWEEGRPDVALTEWRSAAASGDRRAMLALGRLFVQGVGAPQDYVEAHTWFNLAASRGEAAASKERDALASKMTAEQVATAQARAAAWGSAKAETGGLVPEIAELFMPGLGEPLAKLMEDPEKIASVGRELQKLFGRGAAPAVSLKPKCAAPPEGTPRWKDAANKPNCRFWVNCYVPDQIVTWSGTCSGGFADGQGTLKSSPSAETGTLSNGKMHGRWVLRFASGQVEEGPFVDGKRHGRWVVRSAKGTVGKGLFVDGEMHGRWVYRYANGTVAEGPLVDGKPQGRWVVRHRDGKVTETVYVDGVPR